MGFVQLSDNLTSWEWFDDKTTVYVYLWLLLRAEWRATRYRGMEIERGQVITTYTEISEKCGVTIRQARTILDRLKTTGKATVKTTSKFSIITMLEYDCNVKSDSLSDSQMTDKRQTAQQSNDKPTLYNTNIQNTKEQTARSAPPAPSVNRDSLISEYGEQNVALYEQKFRDWKSSKGGNFNVPIYSTIAKWLEQDGVLKYQPRDENSSFDIESVMAQLKARYKNN